MKKSLKILILIVVALVVILAILGGMLKRKDIPNNVNPSGENQEQNIDNVTSNEQEALNQYVALESLPKEYALENARESKDFVILTNGEYYNKEVMDDYIQNLDNGKNSKIRISQENANGKLIILDFEISGDTYILTEDSTRDEANDGKIIKNEYSKNEYEVTIFEEMMIDGNKKMVYALQNIGDSDKKVYLCAYIVNE